MLSFQTFVHKRRHKNVPAWKHAVKYTNAAWSVFGVTIQPDNAVRVRVDNLQGRLRILVAKMQQTQEEDDTFTNIHALIDNPEFINTFYTDDPRTNSRTFAEERFHGITDTHAWTQLFPDEFFGKTYTDDAGFTQTYGAPLQTSPVKYWFGESMAFCMMQELFEYRRRFEMSTYQSRLYAEMDLTFASTLMNPVSVRVYDLDGTIYMVFGEIHTYAPCYKRTSNAITTGKFFVDLAAACPDVRFDVFMENGPKTFLPDSPRRIQHTTNDESESSDEEDSDEEDSDGAGADAGAGAGAGAGARAATSKRMHKEYAACKDRLYDIFLKRKHYLMRNVPLDVINQALSEDENTKYMPYWDDDATYSENFGLLSASHLYFFTAYPSPHAWKSKGLLGNLRLHSEDIRWDRAENDREEVRKLPIDPRLDPLRDTIRELHSDRVFSSPRLRTLTFSNVRGVNFLDLTLTLTRGGAVSVEEDDDDDESKLEDEKRVYKAAGCDFVSATKETIVVTFERVLLKKFHKLPPDMQTRIQHAFQKCKNGSSSLYLVSILTDFYAFVRSLVDTSGGQGRKRVVVLQAGNYHTENWSAVLESLGARQLIAYGRNDRLQKRTITLRRNNVVQLRLFLEQLAGIDLLQPRLEFTSDERTYIQTVFFILDEIKSSRTSLNTSKSVYKFKSIWKKFEQLLEPETGLYDRCASVVLEASELGDQDGRTTNNAPFEVIVIIGTKIQLTLEMFVLDLTTLQHNNNAELDDVLNRAQTHLTDPTGNTLKARIEKHKRALTEGVLIAKRKRDST